MVTSATNTYLQDTNSILGPLRVQPITGGQTGTTMDARSLPCARQTLYETAELYGRHHYSEERWVKDRKRNEVLAARGWFVLRVSGRVLGGANHPAALTRLVALTARHRRAIVL